MGRKYSYNINTYHEHLMSLLPESNFTLDVFSGTEKYCEITCLTCNNHYSFSQAILIARRARRGNKNVCRFCENNTWTKRINEAKNKAQYLLNQKQTIELAGEIDSWASHSNCKWKCLKCNHIFERSPFVMFSQNHLNCPWCETHPFQYDIPMIKTKAYELWGTEYSFLRLDEKKNKNGSSRVVICHNKCGFKYNTSLWNFLHGQGCPRCKASHGERKVRNYLTKYSLIYQEQKSIEVGNTYLKLDFYLEDLSTNKKFAIEYNGIQHYQPVDYFGGQKGYETQVYRDNLKKQYCLDNQIELIIIPYNDESILMTNELAQRLSGQVTE